MPPTGRSADSRRQRQPVVREHSAGGLVLRQGEHGVEGALIACLNRRNTVEWCFPKGHIEVGETAEQAAEREVREETGLTARVESALGSLDYWFVSQGKRIHKVVQFFVLSYVAGDLDDSDKEVAEVAWVPLAQIPQRLHYESQRALIEGLPELALARAQVSAEAGRP